MTTFALFHGAWHGGWVWGRVASHLRATGREVLTPTLTGVSDRAHLLHPGAGMGTHAYDVVALLASEDLHDVVCWTRPVSRPARAGRRR